MADQRVDHDFRSWCIDSGIIPQGDYQPFLPAIVGIRWRTCQTPRRRIFGDLHEPSERCRP